MKTKLNFSFIFCFALAVLAGTSYAQQQYTIKSTLKIEGLPPEYAAMGEQEIVTYIKNTMRKTEMTGMMGGSTIFYDGKKLTSLMDQMGQKKGYVATKEELDAEDKTKKPELKPKIEYTTEQRTIAGYTCTKAIVTTTGEDKKEEKMTVWFTPDINVDRTHSNKGGRGMADLSELKGFPLAIEATRQNQGAEMKINSTATEVLTTAIEDSVFTINTEGYAMMSYKEMKEMSKTAGGK